MQKLSGTVDNLTTVSNVTGSTKNGSGKVQTHHVTKFRLNSRPVSFDGVPNLSNGDNLTVAGIDKNGEFEALMMLNNTTGVKYTRPKRVIEGWALVVVGMPLLFVYGFGAILMIVGGSFLYEANKTKKAELIL